MRLCSCGGIVKQHEVKAGQVWNCESCGKYEVVKEKECYLNQDLIDFGTLCLSHLEKGANQNA